MFLWSQFNIWKSCKHRSQWCATCVLGWCLLHGRAWSEWSDRENISTTCIFLTPPTHTHTHTHIYVCVCVFRIIHGTNSDYLCIQNYPTGISTRACVYCGERTEFVETRFRRISRCCPIIKLSCSARSLCCILPAVHFPSRCLLRFLVLLPCFPSYPTRRTSGHYLAVFRAGNFFWFPL